MALIIKYSFYIIGQEAMQFIHNPADTRLQLFGQNYCMVDFHWWMSFGRGCSLVGCILSSWVWLENSWMWAVLELVLCSDWLREREKCWFLDCVKSTRTIKRKWLYLCSFLRWWLIIFAFCHLYSPNIVLYSLFTKYGCNNIYSYLSFTFLLLKGSYCNKCNCTLFSYR